VRLALVLLVLPWAAHAAGQAVLGTVADGNQVVVFPTPAVGLPSPTQAQGSGFPPGVRPHGVAYYGSDRALVGDFQNGRVFVFDVAGAVRLDTIPTAPTWDASGALAVSPSHGHALGCGGSSTLAVIQAPFGAASVVNGLALPASCPAGNAQNVAFDPAGRAFVGTAGGHPSVGFITVLDPPYTAPAFNMAVPRVVAAVAVTPGGGQVLATGFDGRVFLYTAPFSASSTPALLTVPAASALAGIAVTPDGSRALVVDSAAGQGQVFALAAPFGPSSAVEVIPLPFGLGSPSFEDVGLAEDGQLAVITGNSTTAAPAVFVLAPFTTTGATVHAVTVTSGGRGSGAVRLRPDWIFIHGFEG
jgi:hypothetical protein